MHLDVFGCLTQDLYLYLLKGSGEMWPGILGPLWGPGAVWICGGGQDASTTDRMFTKYTYLSWLMEVSILSSVHHLLSVFQFCDWWICWWFFLFVWKINASMLFIQCLCFVCVRVGQPSNQEGSMETDVCLWLNVVRFGGVRLFTAATDTVFPTQTW